MAGFNQKKPSTPARSFSKSKPQSATKRNASLLNFFQKADGPPQATSRQSRITQFATPSEGSNGSRGKSASSSPGLRRSVTSVSGAGTGAGGLFLEDRNGKPAARVERARSRSRTPDDIWGEGLDVKEDDPQNEEASSSVKRRRVDVTEESEGTNEKKKGDSPRPVSAKSRPTSGPFIDESDSEDDLDAFRDLGDDSLPATDLKDTPSCADEPVTTIDATDSERPPVPPLVREATSHAADDEDTNFDELEEDELGVDPLQFQGEEFLEPLDDDIKEAVVESDGLEDGCLVGEGSLGDNETVCPVCQTRLIALNESDISVHVNDCLDGKPSIIPKNTPTPAKRSSPVERAAIAKPPQPDPYNSGEPAAGTAFSKLMAGNAEDTAWSSAAANEVASRGKQAYQRTCPFYKIMPGFFICVDAFRYGAVEGCSAYFLSHFHSDHYIGLTASWRHGPIYCSKPTANLVRQQLKVNPKWIVALDFEKRTEVPDTGGVQATLIEANHCPGSALFLFEKPVGPQRTQRILHCGDFRASPAHVQHPLLCPHPVDPTTGQRRRQRIDTCYLDTTYLSPKYAFPSQSDVIRACADLCVSLNDGSTNSVVPPGKSTISSTMMNRFISTVTGSHPTTPAEPPPSTTNSRLLIVIGTYSIGKERICLGIARALRSKIYATPAKQRVCACLEDPELTSLLTDDPTAAQVHMQTLFELRADTLADYLDSLKPHFARVVGFRPTGWSYRPPAGRTIDINAPPPVSAVLHAPQWQSPFSVADLMPQRGSTRESACYGVPYSEHSSFRELTMFCCALDIGRVVPTVNVGSKKSREVMRGWIERWEVERRKSGLYRWEGDV
ncbi:DNA cross-link repair protein PSO2 [Aspergillus candidus]|uniref:DRMBL-domain-containing protein n=1 Tax=Aspergillus candidus TaxID=41067 RepID=A0A2I2FE06_ASPCN|nr:DRMBL-domain-containing protein [Aspergillus candidus]PLB38871.1 DRMBL-domain-containing protein [Aspergillus candidus]